MNSADRIIGVDESGKGDFFGPLVVAGFLGSRDDETKLRALNVRDSKMIADSVLLTIAESLKAEFTCFVLVLSPDEYNRRYAKIKNLNKLLAACHAEVITKLHGEHSADLAISDKFGKDERLETALAAEKCNIPLKQIVRGEAILQVAAASILARATFIREMNSLSAEAGITLPKGAAPPVDRAGRAVVERHGIDYLTKLAKLHFKNYQRVVLVNH